jgi:hypothetical protein
MVMSRLGEKATQAAGIGSGHPSLQQGAYFDSTTCGITDKDNTSGR